MPRSLPPEQKQLGVKGKRRTNRFIMQKPGEFESLTNGKKKREFNGVGTAVTLVSEDYGSRDDSGSGGGTQTKGGGKAFKKGGKDSH